MHSHLIFIVEVLQLYDHEQRTGEWSGRARDLIISVAVIQPTERLSRGVPALELAVGVGSVQASGIGQFGIANVRKVSEPAVVLNEMGIAVRSACGMDGTESLDDCGDVDVGGVGRVLQRRLLRHLLSNVVAELCA